MSTYYGNPDCWVKFWDEDDGGNGKNRLYYGPDQQDILDEDWDGGAGKVSGNANKLQTGPSAWIQIFDEEKCQGNSDIYLNNTTAILQDNTSRDGSNWQNQIRSFILYDHPVVPIQPIIDNFFNGLKDLYDSTVYAGHYDMEDSGQHIEFHSQNSKFRITVPTITQPSPGVMSFELYIEHVKETQNDDCTITFSMDTSGRLVGNFVIHYNMSEVKQVPDWAIDVTDLAIDVAEDALKAAVDSCEVIITEGLGAEAVPVTNKIIGYAADALTFTVDHINFLLKVIFKLQENGGTLFFSSIVAQSIHRLMTAYIKTCVDEGWIKVSGSTSAKLSLDYSLIPKNILNKNYQWSKWAEATENYNYSFEIEETKNGVTDNYQVWMPDYTSGYMKTGLLVSVKIDSKLSISSNDYLVVNMLFGPDKELIGLQGTVLFHKADDSDWTPPGSGLIMFNSDRQVVQLTQDDDGNTISKLLPQTSIFDAYLSCFSTSFALTQNTVHYDGGTLNLPNVSIDVVNAIQAAIVTEQ